MKRIFLFIATNLAVVVLLTIVLSALGVDRFLTENGLDLQMLLAFSLIVGFSGSIFSLLISKPMAKWSTGARVIEQPEGAHEQWLVATVRRLADKANIGMPEVAVFEGAPNAFATGAFKNSALVAVSTGLLESMNREEIEAGVVFRTERGIGPGYYVTVIVCQIVFSILASMIVMWFSRRREFRADAGSARLLGTPRPMIGALMRLGGMQPGALPQSMAASGISGAPGWMALFSSHPPIEERIRALQISA